MMSGHGLPLLDARATHERVKGQMTKRPLLEFCLRKPVITGRSFAPQQKHFRRQDVRKHRGLPTSADHTPPDHPRHPMRKQDVGRDPADLRLRQPE